MGVGVKGAAIATTVSQIIGFIYAYYNYIKIKKKNIKSHQALNFKRR